MAATAVAPAGPHTPVTNLTSEKHPEIQELVEQPFPGSLQDAPGEVRNGVEDVPRPLMAAAAAESAWHLPDTSELKDIAIASFGPPPALMETVHGRDNRVRIQATKQYPWRANASLLITARDGSRWLGTGWFIGAHTLVTAGHCVYIHGDDPNQKGWVKSIQVLPGRNGGALPFGAVTATTFWTVKGWTESGDENYDYAAIIIPQDVGTKVGWYGFAVYPDEKLTGAMANVAGYPGDKPDGTLWHDSHAVASVSPTKVYYDIDTAGGQSGAAVYVIPDKDTPDADKRIAVAVHAYGGAATNSGTRITQPVFANFTNWKTL
jgi:V8-like Glu-specific endopeptidase